jgi:hypothetical protein
MSGPIFSPDGKFLWTGEEWIPTPPKENILEESELDEDIIETVASETNIQTEELAETAVHFDLNNDKKIDKEEVEMAAKSLTSEIIPFEQWKSENDKPKNDDEENNTDKSITTPPIPFNDWKNKEVTDIEQNSGRLMELKVKNNALPKKNKFFDYISKQEDIKKIVIAILFSSTIMIIILLSS